MKKNIFLTLRSERYKAGLLLLLLLLLCTTSKPSFAALQVNSCSLAVSGAGGETPFVIKALPVTLTNGFVLGSMNFSVVTTFTKQGRQQIIYTSVVGRCLLGGRLCLFLPVFQGGRCR